MSYEVEVTSSNSSSLTFVWTCQEKKKKTQQMFGYKINWLNLDPLLFLTEDVLHDPKLRTHTTKILKKLKNEREI
jgi:hypothetical protein